MDPEIYVNLVSRMYALELVQRAIISNWLLSTNDPQAANNAFFESLVNSRYTVNQKPTDQAEALLWDGIECALREFQQQISLRISVGQPSK